jgi:hypothetical protein
LSLIITIVANSQHFANFLGENYTLTNPGLAFALLSVFSLI